MPQTALDLLSRSKLIKSTLRRFPSSPLIVIGKVGENGIVRLGFEVGPENEKRMLSNMDAIVVTSGLQVK